MAKVSDKNKLPAKGTPERKFVKRHNRDQAGRPKGKLVKAIPRSNEVIRIVPLETATRKASMDNVKSRERGQMRDDI